MTKPKKEIPRPNNLSIRGAQNKPIVEVPENPETVTMLYRRERGHDACERLRSCRQSEAEGTELEHRLPHAFKTSGNVAKTDGPEPGGRHPGDQGYHPISGTERLENRLGSLHVETGDVHPAVEA